MVTTLFYYVLYDAENTPRQGYDSLEEYCVSASHDQVKKYGYYENTRLGKGKTRAFLREAFLDEEVVDVVGTKGEHRGTLVKKYGTIQNA